MTTLRSRALPALLIGLTTAAYYAVPDVARTRATRGWLKAACVGAGALASVTDIRQAWTQLRTARRGGADHAPAFDDSRFAGTMLDGTPVAAENLADTVLDRTGDGPAPSSAARAAVVGAVGVVAAVGSVAGTVALERWLYRRGEARAAAGVRFAHTRTGLVLGALSAAAALVPDPSERS